MVETKTLDITSPLTPHPALVRYQFGNHLGSASLELDDQAQIISYEEYTPYGGTAYQAVRSGMETSPKRYRYIDKERDGETGFTYHGSRYYAPWLGRWAATDPSGIGDGLNIFAYGRDNPIFFIDLNGRDNIPANDTDRDIMMMTDPQLYTKLLSMSKTERNAYASAAEGAFSGRAWAVLNKYHMEREVQLDPVVSESQIADSVLQDNPKTSPAEPPTGTDETDETGGGEGARAMRPEEFKCLSTTPEIHHHLSNILSISRRNTNTRSARQIGVPPSKD